MSKARNTGNLNNSIQISDTGNITFVSGSTTLLAISSSGAVTTTGVISGSNALSASFAATASFVTLSQTASFVANAQSASNAVSAITASSADNLLVRNTLTAQTIVVQTITSSIDWVTGSAKFGSINSNAHTFTGSVSISGSSTFGLNVNNNALYVSASGNIGIGTSNTTQRLTVSGSVSVISTGGFISMDGVGVASTPSGLGYGLFPYESVGLGISSVVGIGIFTNNPSTEKIRITSTGLVGIGTLTPSSLLHVSSSAAASTIFRVDTAASNGTLFVSSSGNIGISTTNPQTPLQILRDTNTNGTSVEEANMAFTVLSAAGQSKIAIGACNAGNYGYVQVMQDQTSWTNRALVLQPRGGSVGIGTTNPSSKLEVLNGQIRVSGTTAQAIYLIGASTVKPYITLNEFGVADWNIAVGQSATNTLSITKTLAGTDGIIITSGGDLLVGTTSSAYSATGRGLIVANGSTNSLFGWSVGGTSKGYLYHNGTNAYLENTNNGGIFDITQVGAGSITFNVNASERMRITSGGNVLVGYNQATTSIIGRTFATSHASGNRGAVLFYGIDDGSTGGMYVYNVASISGGYNSQYITFGTHEGGVDAGERMRIYAGGNIAINKNLAVGRAEENGVRLSVTSVGTTSAAYNIISRDSSGNDLFVLRNDGLYYTGTRSLSPYNYGVTAGVKALYVDSNGAIGYNASTRESKANITNIDSVSWIHSLQPVTFNKKKKDNEGNYTEELESELQYGLIAEDVESINPNFVFYNSDGKLAGVHYDRLVTPLIKAIQELKAENDSLKEILQRNNIV